MLISYKEKENVQRRKQTTLTRDKNVESEMTTVYNTDAVAYSIMQVSRLF